MWKSYLNLGQPWRNNPLSGAIIPAVVVFINSRGGASREIRPNQEVGITVPQFAKFKFTIVPEVHL
jgi:hypothetical protein